jgi:hypothetical protein
LIHRALIVVDLFAPPGRVVAAITDEAPAACRAGKPVEAGHPRHQPSWPGYLGEQMR